MNKHLRCMGIAFVFLLCNLNLYSQSDGNHATQADKDYIRSFFSSYGQINGLGSIPSQPTSLPVQVYIVRQSNGTGGVTEGQVEQALNSVNQIFSGSSLQFDVCNVVDVNNSNYFDYEMGSNDVQLTSTHYNKDAINLYCVRRLTDQGKSIDSYGSFPTHNNQMAVISETAAMGISPLAHQFGHMFGLLDTDEDSFGPELANGVNCFSAGDFICDTPADPGLAGNVDQNCNYTGTDRDHRRNFYEPSVRNIMSSAPNSCRSTFSEVQLQVIYASFKKSMQNLVCKPIQTSPDLTCKEINTLKVDGTKINIENVWIANQGTANAGAFHIGYYLSSDNHFTTSDYLIGEDKISSLGAGKSIGESFSVDVASLEIPVGNYFVGFIVDYKGQVNEVDEQNNNDCSWTNPKVVISEKKPNLACSEPGKLTIEYGEIKIEDTWIINNGHQTASASQVGYYLSKDDHFTTSDYRIGSVYLDEIKAGKTVGASFKKAIKDIDIPKGTYFVGFILDYNNKISESNESDNNDCFWKHPKVEISEAKPDLACREPGTLKIDEYKLKISNVWLENRGKGKAESSYLGYYLSKDKTITTSDYRIGTDYVGPLAAHETEGENFEIWLDDIHIEPGTYYVGLIIDYKNQIDEENEYNNNDCVFDSPRLVVKPPKPDLACREPGKLVIDDEKLKISNVWLENRGKGKAEASYVGYYLSKDKTITTSDYRIGNDYVGPLAAHETEGESFEIRLDDIHVEPGTYYVGLILDYQNLIEEDNEHNNNDCVFDSPRLVVKPPKPDLACREPGKLVIDDYKLKISNVWLENRGKGKAEASYLGYYLSKDKTITTSDYRIGSDYVGPLAAHETEGESFEIRLEDIHVEPGTYYVGLIVDYKKQVDEENEYNNNDCVFDSPRLVVKPPKPDLACREPGKLVIDNYKLKISGVWLENKGKGKADGSSLGYYLSKDKTITTSDYRIGSDYIGPLAAHETEGESFQIDLDDINVEPGTYYVGLLVDYKNQVDEENESNNNDCVFDSPQLVVKPPFPDLACREPGKLVIDDYTLKISGVWLENRGEGYAGPSSLGYYLSKDKTITTSDYRIGSDYIGALAAHETEGESFQIDLDDINVEPGTYYVGLLVDYKKQVTEENESNNNDCVFDSPQLVVKPPKPDLACREPGTLKIDDYKLKISNVWLENRGKGDAGASYIGYYLSKDKTITTSDYRIGSDYVSPLASHETEGESFEINLDQINVEPGTYYVGLLIDYKKQISEENESNNNDCVFDSPRLVVKPPKPDLACREPGTLKIDDYKLRISNVWLENRGKGKAEASYLGYYLSKDKIITTSDYRIGRDYVGALAANETEGEHFEINIKDINVEPGTYYVGLLVDYNNQVDEENESNNNDCVFDSPKLVVKPDLACREPGVLKIDDYKLTISDIWLENRGTGKADASSVGYYLSKDKTITTSDYRIGSDYVGPLGVHETEAEHFEIDLDDIHIEPGTYYVGLLLDYKNQVAEKNESNNNDCVFDSPRLVVKPPKPDLACREPGTLKIDDYKLRISNVWLENRGKGKAEASYLGYYLSKDKTITTSDYRIGSDYVGPLDPKQTEGEHFEIDLDDINVEPGTYYVGLLIDYKKQVEEENEYNNNDCVFNSPKLVVKPPKPNLACKERGYLHMSGSQLEISDIWLTNNGHSKAGGSNLGLYLSKDKTISTSDYRIGSKYIKELNPGQNTSAGFWIDLKDFEIPAGYYYVGLYLDYQNQVDEENEYDNNDCYWTNPIEIQEGKPNLTCLERGFLYIDQHNRLEIEDIWLKNDGHSKANGSYLGLYLSKDKHITTSDILIDSDYIKPLSPGEKTEASFWLDLNKLHLPEGTYYVGLFLDYKNQVHEEDEYDNNDCYWTNPTVKIVSNKKPNLACLEKGIININGSQITIKDTWLINEGPGQAEASKIGLYLSKDKVITTSDILIDTDHTKSLAAHETTDASFAVNLNNFQIPAGTYYVGLLLDYQNYIDETDEGDNNDCYWNSPRVTIQGGSNTGGCKCKNQNANEICENFEDYNSGMIAAQSSCWVTWNNRAGSHEDAKVKSASNNKYLSLEGSFNGAGAQNVLMKLGDRTSGTYELQFKINVTTGKNGYYALMHYHSSGSSTSEAHNIRFGSNGIGYLQVGSQRTGFYYDTNKWITIKQIIDIDNDQTTLFVNGTAVKTWAFRQIKSYSDVNRSLGIGALNFYPQDWNFDFKIDDISFKKVTNGNFVHQSNSNSNGIAESSRITNFQLDKDLELSNPMEARLSELVIYPNPSKGIFTISGPMGEGSDMVIQIMNMQGQAVLNRKINAQENILESFDLGEQAPGMYLVNFISGESTVTKRMIVK